MISIRDLEREIRIAFGPVFIERDINSASVWMHMAVSGYKFEMPFEPLPRLYFNIVNEIYTALKLFENGGIVWC